MKQLTTLLILFITVTQVHAKIWRVNNNVGVNADFTTFNAAVNSGSVLAGDTLHIEASATTYSTASVILNKRLVVIGVGYFLDPADVTTPGNAGLQVATQRSAIDFIRVADGANGSRFIGITFPSGVYLNGSAATMDVLFEKDLFLSSVTFETGTINGVAFRKCFFNSAQIGVNAPATVTNFTCENSIFNGFNAYLNLGTLSGSGNVMRNNTFYATYIGTLSNVYFANNIISDANYEWVFTNCTVKNNLFAKNQALPGTATANQVNVNMTNVFTLAGSYDGRLQLKAGSPAIGAGLTVGGVVSPDCGAFGATDPYRLSGIPNVPAIYSLTVPTSIPSGSATMNVTFSTRNNN